MKRLLAALTLTAGLIGSVLYLYPHSVTAQQGVPVPNCLQILHFTNRTGDNGNGSQQVIQFGNPSSSFNNITTGCTSWSLSYNAEGVTALSIVLQDAPNSYSSGIAPSTFVTFAGTTVTGSNPMADTNAAQYTATGYYPWTRVNITSVTGTGSVDVTLAGWKSPVFVGGVKGATGVAGGSSGIYQLVNGVPSIQQYTIRPVLAANFCVYINSAAPIGTPLVWRFRGFASDGVTVNNTLDVTAPATATIGSYCDASIGSAFQVVQYGEVTSFQLSGPSNIVSGTSLTFQASTTGVTGITGSTGSCGSITGSIGCTVATVNGIVHYVPYF